MEDYFKNKKILITGGLGFIGSTLAHRLVKMGADIYLIDSLIPEYGGNNFNINGIEDKVKVNIADVRDKHSMDYLVKGKDIIFNLAGTLSHIDSMNDPFTDLEINCRSQLSILESCRKNNRDIKIVFAGTRGQYGKADHLPVDENHLMHPTDVNGINNIAGESYHILYNNIYGIRAVSLRLTNTYGPRHQMKHPKQGIINWFIRQLIEGQTIKLYGDGKQIRDINYVDDVVEALLLVACSEKANGEVFNIGGIPKNLIDLVETMIGVYNNGNYELVPFKEDLKKIEIGNYVANYEKIKRTVGWQPKVSLEEGLRSTFDYYEKYKKHYW
ncbi:MAG: dTDP-glucose 4,6-dehydratase [Candidatus Scalindua rubra]|uniref:dTDP-glucose 4,6-dehydratase n=1 Tax=Candidatus Scalindua rubra TaxID=1872076 RepID=A0A1E3XGI4_9BACT|nr:MAG: dTDP-glucose 4,6-dehydratase [Candidatus Scalindua rubra]